SDRRRPHTGRRRDRRRPGRLRPPDPARGVRHAAGHPVPGWAGLAALRTRGSAMVTTPTTAAAATAVSTGADITATGVHIASVMAARHMVASAVVCDPHPADSRPRVLLVW